MIGRLEQPIRQGAMHESMDGQAPSFVLWPLAEIAPDLVHPVVGKSCTELWAGFDKARETLAPIELGFAGS